LAEAFGLSAQPSLFARYNIAPSQAVPVIRVLRENPNTKERELVPLRWGLVPSWASDPAIGNRLINARSETVADKPSFRGRSGTAAA
jgi:putative SOS response-associated peptidase YedK